MYTVGLPEQTLGWFSLGLGSVVHVVEKPYEPFCFTFDRERATAHRTLRRQDKKMKELQSNVEDERKQAEVYKADVSIQIYYSFFCVS